MVGNSGNQKICTIAYPKSGISWATKLFAECIGCPARSLQVKDDPVNDGLDRQSEFTVYKDHGFPSFVKSRGVESENVIYVVRDVRDIVISSAHYFSKVQSKFRGKITVPVINKFIEKINSDLYGHGAWPSHVEKWLRHEVKLVRYEDLWDDTRGAVSKVLSAFGFDIPDDIDGIIHKHSFEVRKKLAEQKKIDHHEMWAKFIRAGTPGQYKKMFTDAQKKRSERLFGHVLSRLGYEV
jgi:hypothetical protein